MEVLKINLDESKQTSLTAYLTVDSPELTPKLRPAVLIMPGGAYQNWSDREAEPIALAFLAEGYQAFILRYTLSSSGQFSESLKDAETALKMIMQKAKDWRVNTDQIVACGFSAGGHLAAMLGTTGSIRPGALILGYPCILSEMGKIMNYPIPSANQEVDSLTPPTFIFATRDDELVPIKNTLAFATALDETKIPFELHLYAHGRHGLSLAKPITANGLKYFVNPRVATWFTQACSWLNELWHPFVAELQFQLIKGGSLVEQPLEYLWQSAIDRKIIKQFLPFLNEADQINKLNNVSLQQIHDNAPEILTSEALKQLEQQLVKPN